MWETNDDVSAVAVGNEATMEVNGSIERIEVGSNLKEVVLATARKAGFGKFRFYIDGIEVLPQDAPLLIEPGTYKVAPYDVAG